MQYSSQQSKRRLIPLVPDVPYHIQLLFVFIMGYIWRTAFDDDYENDYDFFSDSVEAQEINVGFHQLCNMIRFAFRKKIGGGLSLVVSSFFARGLTWDLILSISSTLARGSGECWLCCCSSTSASSSFCSITGQSMEDGCLAFLTLDSMHQSWKATTLTMTTAS